MIIITLVKLFRNIKSQNLAKKNKLILNKLQKLTKKHISETLENKLGYILLDKNKIISYCFYLIENKKTIKIDWIWSTRGYGTYFLKKLEKKWVNLGYSRIRLNVSVDPTELKTKVIIRINFYIKNNYRVFDIQFRKKYGPLLRMHKLLK